MQRSGSLDPDTKYEIYIYTYLKGSRQLVPTGKKIEARSWNKKRGSLRLQSREAYLLDKELKAIEQKAKEILLKFGPGEFKSRLKAAISEGERGFFSAFEDYLRAIASDRSKATVTKYRSLKKSLEEMEKDLGPITFERIDLTFYDQFTAWFYRNGYLKNTVGKNVRILKTFLKWALERGYHENGSFTRFKGFHEIGEIIYLTEAELKILEEAELSPREDRVRDLYLLGVYTGQRFSDVQDIRSGSIEGGYLKKSVVKTREKDHVIPLSKKALKILEKYPEGPPRISNQKCNKYLKDLFKDLGFTSLISKVRYSGSREIKEQIPKYKLLGTHTARKTFITLSLIKGMPEAAIMDIAGIKDFKTLRHYLKITDRYKADNISKFWD